MRDVLTYYLIRDRQLVAIFQAAELEQGDPPAIRAARYRDHHYPGATLAIGLLVDQR